VQDDCPQEELERAARTSVALDRLVAEHDLGSMAYYYMGTGNVDNEDAISSIILGNSLLTARGVPVAGEYEVKNAQAMKIMDCLRRGRFVHRILCDGLERGRRADGPRRPRPHRHREGKTKVRPLNVYHGKVGRGLSVEMSVKHGPVTLLSVVETDGGSSCWSPRASPCPGPILEIGNTNSRYKFGIGARRAPHTISSTTGTPNGPAHHCAVGVGQSEFLNIADQQSTSKGLGRRSRSRAFSSGSRSRKTSARMCPCFGSRASNFVRPRSKASCRRNPCELPLSWKWAVAAGRADASRWKVFSRRRS
jgi:L-arabinose isomerase